MKFCSIALLLLALVAADNWAVLVAGSDGFWNYRHQSDVSHAYQIMRKGGIPAEHIIVMMADDVATSDENPFPGQLYNHPGDDVPDVYERLRIPQIGLRGNGCLCRLLCDLYAPRQPWTHLEKRGVAH